MMKKTARKLHTIPVFLAFLVMLFYIPLSAAEKSEQEPPKELFENFKINNKIDEFVVKELQSEMFPPSETCSDAVFLRRVFIDVTGTLPDPREARAFLNDKGVNKRAKLIDRLLQKKEFADYWSSKWGDLLRIKAEFPSNLWPYAAEVYSRWVRDSLQENMPYDLFVRKLLTSNGSNFRDPPVNFYRAFQQRTPQNIAENAVQLFLGMRLKESGLSEAEQAGIAAFFTKLGYKGTEEWKEEIVYFNPDGKPLLDKEGKPVLPTPLAGDAIVLASDKDPRIAFADWVTSPKNPWFTKAIVNRVWYWLLGRGMIHEPDDLKTGNEPWNAELIKYLETELIDNKYDLKHIYRLILNSNTYQLSAKENQWNAADEDGFSRYRVRRLDAEVIIDAVCQVTGGGENYHSPIPEPFTYLPGNQKAVLIPDGSISSPFLEMFGRPPRNTSYESERNSVLSVSQVQHFLNSGNIEKKIEQSRPLSQMFAQAKTNKNIIDELYLRILSRFPEEEERAVADKYFSVEGKKQTEAAIDLAWALFNTTEFILKH